MLTVFGKCLRRIRLEEGQLLKDMANKLDVTPAYLSAIENGKRKPTKELVNKLIAEYDLNSNQIQELNDSFAITVDQITINISDFNYQQSELGLVFARKIDSLSKEQIERIKDILKD